MKRFYKETAVDAGDGGFRVLLDGKPMRTPAKAVLVVPTEALAEAIAAEWRGVPEKAEINAAHLPLTRLAATGLDRVPTQRARVIDDTAKYAGSDMLCYRATAPTSLVQRQQRDLAAAARLGGRALWRAARGGRAARPSSTQPPTRVAALRAAVAAHGDLALSALYNLTHIAGSLVIALAVSEGRLAGGPRHSPRRSSTSSTRSSAGATIRSPRSGTKASAAISRPARASSRCSATHD